MKKAILAYVIRLPVSSAVNSKEYRVPFWPGQSLLTAAYRLSICACFLSLLIVKLGCLWVGGVGSTELLDKSVVWVLSLDGWRGDVVLGDQVGEAGEQ